MGAENAKIDGSKIKFVLKRKMPYFGLVSHYQCLGQENLIIGVSNNQQNVDYLEHVALKHKNFLNLLTFDVNLSDILLGYKPDGLQLYYEHIPITLQNIIQGRRSRNQYFSYQEYNRLINDLLSVLLFLEQTQSIAHYNINVGSVFYQKETKRICLYDNQSIHGKYDCYYQIIKRTGEHYFNPEVLKALKIYIQHKHEYNYSIDQRETDYMFLNRSKSDIYMLGLTLLEVGTYLPSISLSNYQTMEIHHREIEARLAMMKQIYNQNLEFEILIREMLKIDPVTRMSAIDLIQYKKQLEKQKTHTFLKPQMVVKPMGVVHDQRVHTTVSPFKRHSRSITMIQKNLIQLNRTPSQHRYSQSIIQPLTRQSTPDRSIQKNQYPRSVERPTQNIKAFPFLPKQQQILKPNNIQNQLIQPNQNINMSQKYQNPLTSSVKTASFKDPSNDLNFFKNNQQTQIKDQKQQLNTEHY